MSMKKDFLKEVISYINEHSMISPGDSAVLGVSGGADSVCLLRVMVDYGVKVKVVHINHMIRGEEADRDEQFVTDLCEKLGVECKVYREDIPKMAREQHFTEEEAGRIFRYRCFEKEADAPETKIAIAHNKDDLAETVLYNLIRGSSLLGLAGIKPVRGRIIRPLLTTSRSDIEEYLNEIGQDYMTDSTNLEPEYARNKIRLSVMPLLKEINEGAADHLVEIAKDAFKLGDEIKKEAGSDNKDKEDANNNEIKVDSLKSLTTLAQGELVLSTLENVCGRRKDITRDHIQLVLGLVDMETGKSVNLPYGMTAQRSYDKIVVTRGDEKEPEDGEPIKVKGSIETSIYPYDKNVSISKKEYTKMIDYDKINSALVLRTPGPDDFIVVDGRGGTKKLSRYFTHAKVERNERLSFPVVADGDEIVWIVGLRLSERYKVEDSTKRVMEIRYVSEDIKEI